MNNLIGILGANPNNCAAPEKIHHGIEHFHMEGYEAQFSEELSPTESHKLTEVKFNWVVSLDGLSLAQELKSEYNIPYLTALPVGKRSMFIWRNAVNDMMENTTAQHLTIPNKVPPRADNLNHHILLIGDSVLTTGIKQFLVFSEGFTHVDTAMYAASPEKIFLYNTALNKASASTLEDSSLIPSMYFSDSAALQNIITKYDIIIGDKIFYNKLPNEVTKKQHWVYLPASGLTQNTEKEFYTIFGKKGAAWLQKELNLPVTEIVMQQKAM